MGVEVQKFDLKRRTDHIGHLVLVNLLHLRLVSIL